MSSSFRVLATVALTEAMMALEALDYVTAQRAAYVALQMLEVLDQRRSPGPCNPLARPVTENIDTNRKEETNP